MWRSSTGKARNGTRLVPGSFPGGDHRRVAITPVLGELGEARRGGVDGRRGVDLARHTGLVGRAARDARDLGCFTVPKFLVDGGGRPDARNAVGCFSIEHKIGHQCQPDLRDDLRGRRRFPERSSPPTSTRPSCAARGGPAARRHRWPDRPFRATLMTQRCRSVTESPRVSRPDPGRQGTRLPAQLSLHLGQPGVAESAVHVGG